jgi:hypothetical protein
MVGYMTVHLNLGFEYGATVATYFRMEWYSTPYIPR